MSRADEIALIDVEIEETRSDIANARATPTGYRAADAFRWHLENLRRYRAHVVEELSRG